MSDTSRCAAIDTLLPWYVNGTLPEEERRAVGQHLAGCGRCADEARWLAAVQAEFPRPDIRPPDGRSAGALLDRIRRERRRRERWQFLAAAAVLITVAAVAGSLLADYLFEPRYRTVTQPVPRAGVVVRFKLFFEPGTPLEVLRAIMAETGAAMVGVPGADGTVVLELPLRQGTTAADVRAALARYPGVVHVVPIDEGDF